MKKLEGPCWRRRATPPHNDGRLFDMREDPREQDPILDDRDAGHQEVRARLEAALEGLEASR